MARRKGRLRLLVEMISESGTRTSKRLGLSLSKPEPWIAMTVHYRGIRVAVKVPTAEWNL